MSQPQVPPRPTRSQAAAPPAAQAQPVVPPRPARRDDRSQSPRSPLNDSPFPVDASTSLHRVASLNASRSSLDLPARPPSVSLPSIGQEGIEYEASTPREDEDEAVAGLGDAPAAAAPTHTRKVSRDLPLHAPRPSLSTSDAKQRVAAVVRTDSNAASAAAKQPLKPKTSFQRPESSSSYHERPGSAHEEHGIPHFGVQVPLGSQYGDVQAPSPAPGSQPHTPTLPAEGSRPGTGRHHNRKHSGRNSFQAPPGSYGLHGHGVQDTADPFEKDWLAKHPDALREEIAAHSPAILDRHDYNLTPAELNKLVKQSREAGFGASSHVSMPDEQIGYLVSEKYEKTDAVRSGQSGSSTVHVDAPAYKESKHLGRGQVAEQNLADLGPHGGDSEREAGWHDESGYSVPILASDEIDPSGSYLQPAVPPEARRGSAQFDDHSRPSSRPGSVHNVPSLSRLVSRSEAQSTHTLLEDVREYEPLFPEDEKPGAKPLTPAERFKQRPDLKQRFPSQDIWEDAPASVMMSTEVETPEPEEPSTKAKPTFETPESEAARKGEVTEAERSELLSKEARIAKSQFKPHLKQEMRPNTHRFPSRDIWEDTPDSAYITTTVGEEEDEGEKNLADEAGAVVSTSSVLPREGATAGAPAVALPADGASRPVVPPRPGARGLSPGKATPQVPSRPARRPSPANDTAVSPTDQAKSAEASESTEAASSTKPKPPVPARMGNKIAALQAGFMSDLNKKLGLGPQERQPKKEVASEEPSEEDKKPLEDARKGRARGPARRKPAASPSAAAPASKSQTRKFVMTPVVNLYDISPSGALTATHADTWSQNLEFKEGLEDVAKTVQPAKDAPVAREVPPAVGFNAAGESVHAPMVTPEAVRATAQTETTPALAAESEASAKSGKIATQDSSEEPPQKLTKEPTSSTL